MSSFSLREYLPSDLPRSADLAAQAWPIVASIAAPNDLPRLMGQYVQMALFGTTWKQAVVDTNGQVAGFLFGGVHRKVSFRQKLRALVAINKLYQSMITGEIPSIQDPKAFFDAFIATERAVQKHTPKTEATIQLFVVDAAFRGQGLGRRLMDAFFDSLVNKKVNVVDVYTDPLSTWQFYESYGFVKHAEFLDPLNTLLTGEPTAGFVYLINAKERNRKTWEKKGTSQGLL